MHTGGRRIKRGRASVKSESVSVGGKLRMGLGGMKRKGRHLRFPTVTDGRGGKKETDTLHHTHCPTYLLAALLFLPRLSIVAPNELGHCAEAFREQHSIGEGLETDKRGRCKGKGK